MEEMTFSLVKDKKTKTSIKWENIYKGQEKKVDGTV